MAASILNNKFTMNVMINVYETVKVYDKHQKQLFPKTCECNCDMVLLSNIKMEFCVS